MCSKVPKSGALILKSNMSEDRILTSVYPFLMSGKQNKSPGSSSPFEWTSVKSKRKETSDVNDKALETGDWTVGSANYRKTADEPGNSGATTRGKGKNSKYGRSVSDNTSNRNSKKNNFNAVRRTASEGRGRRR